MAGHRRAAAVASNAYDLGVPDSEAAAAAHGEEVERPPALAGWARGGPPAGTLEVAKNGRIVLRSEGKYYVNPDGTIVAPASGSIVTQPRLTAEVDSPDARSASLGLAYLTRGLSWSADYVARLDPASDEMALESWATVTNTTGTDFPNAKITLMAGSPSRAAVEAKNRRLQDYDVSAPMAEVAEASALTRRPEPRAVGGLYAYPVEARASLVQDRMNRVRMISSGRVPIKRDYSVALPGIGGWEDGSWRSGGNPPRLNAQLAVSFANASAGGLGVPLPSGAVRAYELESGGRSLYIGASALRDTPKDAKAFLSLSDAFDVTAEPRLVSSKRLDKKTVRKEMRVALHNARVAPVTLRVVQPFYGPRKTVSQSLPSRPLDAQTMEWKITIPAGGRTTLAYTVDMKG